MRLYIAEKPSLARAIADVLPKPHKICDGCIYVGNGDCVSWCIGHLLEQVEPDVYDPAYKQWRFEHLPIIPQQWRLQPKKAAKKQLSILRKLVKGATELVHAGDPDREGQLLVDQLVEFLGVTGQRRKRIQRCLVNDLNPPAVQRALNEMRSNKDFVPLSISALARSRADWLYGINMTRAFTLHGRKVGYDGVLSVGRVQTPVLGLVVHRDRDINCFEPKPFYQVIAHIRTVENELFKAKWLPSDACQPYQDEDGRVLSLGLAKKVVASISGKPALVTSAARFNKKQTPPLPYNLSALQIDAAKHYGLSAQQVLDSCQTLYERHKLLTYPRSDSRYLPTQHFLHAPPVLTAIASNSSALQAAVNEADPQRRSKAWNDNKVDAHHAIIPTEKTGDLTCLTQTEQRLYHLVSRQYIAQFYPHHEFQDSEIHLEIAGGHFVAKSRESQLPGWKSLFEQQTAKNHKSTDSNAQSEAALNTHLPTVKKGEELHCYQGELLEKQTSPPKPFNDASLLAAMTGIGRYVDDKSLRAILKETDGLGTEATRAGIIELLFKRGFLVRTGKQIRASDAGKALIDSLPPMATQPDMTARWEMELNAISRREANYLDFMQPLEVLLKNLITQSKNESMQNLMGLKSHSGYVKKRTVRKTKTNNKALSRKKRVYKQKM
ncbi:DNA topoisomerase III [Candidatus Endobugula sertula]|uniref:DNA topoisomerase 3 n=1 Tax=Candidatus Endobugula sertula TaxID=62101 RepID=A0A1D2QPJ3_9GAMM|nr:DNA topoisomerase III [Candidatus Endobugula sertula]